MLLDTSGLLCLLHRAEPYHEQACAAYKTARDRLTTDYAVAELIALATVRRLRRQNVLYFVEDLLGAMTHLPTPSRRQDLLVPPSSVETGSYDSHRHRESRRSRTTGLYFSMDPERGQVVLEDVATGDRLLSAEEEEARQKAEIRAAREKTARLEVQARAEEAEAEVARLREELEHLRRGGQDEP